MLQLGHGIPLGARSASAAQRSPQGGIIGLRAEAVRRSISLAAVRFAVVATDSKHVDVKRRAGWLPDQDALESWLAGHRERVDGTSVSRWCCIRS